MSFAARFSKPTGFDTVGMATAFSVNASSAAGFADWIWTLNTDGTITRTNIGFGTVVTDTFSPSWGLPAVVDGANWEASVQITSGSITRTGTASTSLILLCKDSDGSGGVTFGLGTITPQTTAWFSLDVARRIADIGAHHVAGGDTTTALVATVFIRHKVTLQQFSQSVNVNVTSA
jgi:hypothetical protein